MMWWESREAWREEEGRARQRREEGSGKRWERRRRQSSGDLHHDRKDRERNCCSVCGRTEAWVTN